MPTAVSSHHDPCCEQTSPPEMFSLKKKGGRGCPQAYHNVRADTSTTQHHPAPTSMRLCTSGESDFQILPVFSSLPACDRRHYLSRKSPNPSIGTARAVFQQPPLRILPSKAIASSREAVAKGSSLKLSSGVKKAIKLPITNVVESAFFLLIIGHSPE